MAERRVVKLIDDRDGGPATQTIHFGLDGQQYEIDLSDEHALELRNAIETWRMHARKANRRPARAAVRIDLGPSNQVLRAWAQANGHKVSTRGRIPEDIRSAYERAHPS